MPLAHGSADAGIRRLLRIRIVLCLVSVSQKHMAMQLNNIIKKIAIPTQKSEKHFHSDLFLKLKWLSLFKESKFPQKIILNYCKTTNSMCLLKITSSL